MVHSPLQVRFCCVNQGNLLQGPLIKSPLTIYLPPTPGRRAGLHNLVNINKTFTLRFTWLVNADLPHRLLQACSWVMEPAGVSPPFLTKLYIYMECWYSKTIVLGNMGTQL